MKKAKVKVTILGQGGTYIAQKYMSTDLPAEALGEVVAEALQLAWKAGADPAKCVCAIQFS